MVMGGVARPALPWPTEAGRRESNPIPIRLHRPCSTFVALHGGEKTRKGGRDGHGGHGFWPRRRRLTVKGSEPLLLVLEVKNAQASL